MGYVARLTPSEWDLAFKIISDSAYDCSHPDGETGAAHVTLRCHSGYCENLVDAVKEQFLCWMQELDINPEKIKQFRQSFEGEKIDYYQWINIERSKR